MKATLLLGMWGSSGKASSDLSCNQGLHLHKCHKIEWATVQYDLRKKVFRTERGRTLSQREEHSGSLCCL